MQPVYVNGKFTLQRTTGVQRVARETLRALDGLVEPGRWTLLCPPGAESPPLARIAVRHVGPAALPPTLWEQTVLPRAAADGQLLNLAGSAPAFARRQAVLVHDAAVFDHPEAYKTSFVLWYRGLFRHLHRRGDGLATVSAFSRGRLAAALGRPEADLPICPPGAGHLDSVPPDDRLRHELGLADGRYDLAVGSRNPTKNQRGLLAAWAQLRAADHRLVIVGGANDRVFAGSGDGTDPPGVLRLGPVDDRTLVSLYRGARALVFPSTYEGFGLPPLEAMAQGCPVLVCRAASLPEVCGDAALYAKDGSVPALLDAWRRLDADPALRARLAAAGPARAAHWTWGATASAVRALVET